MDDLFFKILDEAQLAADFLQCPQAILELLKGGYRVVSLPHVQDPLEPMIAILLPKTFNNPPKKTKL